MSVILKVFLVWLLIIATTIAGAYFHGYINGNYISDFWWGSIFGFCVGIPIISLYRHKQEQRKNKEKAVRYIAGIIKMSRTPTYEEVCGILADALGVKVRNLKEIWEEIKAKERR